VVQGSKDKKVFVQVHQVKASEVIFMSRKHKFIQGSGQLCLPVLFGAQDIKGFIAGDVEHSGEKACFAAVVLISVQPDLYKDVLQGIFCKHSVFKKFVEGAIQGWAIGMVKDV
jgi:hypothetical protein